MLTQKKIKKYDKQIWLVIFEVEILDQEAILLDGKKWEDKSLELPSKMSVFSRVSEGTSCNSYQPGKKLTTKLYNLCCSYHGSVCDITGTGFFVE